MIEKNYFKDFSNYGGNNFLPNELQEKFRSY